MIAGTYDTIRNLGPLPRGARIREDCRLCGCTRLRKVLELPRTPLANEFPKEPGRPQDEFPLELGECIHCGHVQLGCVVDPARLFRDYVYVSGTSPVFVDHFRRYADAMMVSLGLKEGDLVVEVGSNDGTLLGFFKAAGMRVLGVDPARLIAGRASAAGIETWPEFFTQDTAARILAKYGHADLVVANNVCAHSDDLAAIARAAKRVLDPEGAFVLEVSYLVDVIKKTLFDTIYHEHLSYHAVEPLLGFFSGLGMSLVDAERVDTHGGSIRVVVRPVSGLPYSQRAAELVAEERELGLGPTNRGRDPFAELATRIEQRRASLEDIVRDAMAAGKTVAGYGAPAKATTLLRTLGIEDTLDFVVDDSPLKQGRWMPGGKIQVLPSSAIDERRPDLVVVLAWNFAESIIGKLSGYRARGGKCVVPLPEVRIVD